jgi:hypothetical protein
MGGIIKRIVQHIVRLHFAYDGKEVVTKKEKGRNLKLMVFQLMNDLLY